MVEYKPLLPSTDLELATIIVLAMVGTCAVLVRHPDILSVDHLTALMLGLEVLTYIIAVIAGATLGALYGSRLSASFKTTSTPRSSPNRHKCRDVARKVMSIDVDEFDRAPECAVNLSDAIMQFIKREPNKAHVESTIMATMLVSFQKHLSPDETNQKQVLDELEELVQSRNLVRKSIRANNSMQTYYALPKSDR